VQECKESKVEIYKSIWGLVFMCNDSERQFNSHKNIAIKEMRENKRKNQTRTQDVTEFGLKCLRLRYFKPLTIEVEPKH
jgi:hypothetical protein